jgi:hypothetical protein
LDPEDNAVVHLAVELKHVVYLLQQHNYLRSEIPGGYLHNRYKLYCRYPQMGNVQYANLSPRIQMQLESIVGTMAQRLSKSGATTNLVDAQDEYGAINPYDVDGFQCKSCMQTLSNVYMHCMGCETLLGKDYNICVRCFRSGYHLINEPSTSKDALGNSTASRHAVGHQEAVCYRASKGKQVGFDADQYPDFTRHGVAGRACCSQRSCAICDMCYVHDCRCHTVFQSRYRFINTENLITRKEEMFTTLQRHYHLLSNAQKKKAFLNMLALVNRSTPTTQQKGDVHEVLLALTAIEKEWLLYDVSSACRRSSLVARRTMRSMLALPPVLGTSLSRLCSLYLLSVSTTVELVVNQMDWARGMLIGHTGSDSDRDSKSESESESSNESSSTSSPVVLFRHVSIEWSPVSDTSSSSLFPFTFDLLDDNRRALQYEHLQWYQISETEKSSSGKGKPKRKADSGSDRKSTKKRKGKGKGGAMSKQ